MADPHRDRRRRSDRRLACPADCHRGRHAGVLSVSRGHPGLDCCAARGDHRAGRFQPGDERQPDHPGHHSDRGAGRSHGRRLPEVGDVPGDRAGRMGGHQGRRARRIRLDPRRLRAVLHPDHPGGLPVGAELGQDELAVDPRLPDRPDRSRGRVHRQALGCGSGRLRCRLVGNQTDGALPRPGLLHQDHPRLGVGDETGRGRLLERRTDRAAEHLHHAEEMGVRADRHVLHQDHPGLGGHTARSSGRRIRLGPPGHQDRLGQDQGHRQGARRVRREYGLQPRHRAGVEPCGQGLRRPEARSHALRHRWRPARIYPGPGRPPGRAVRRRGHHAPGVDPRGRSRLRPRYERGCTHRWDHRRAAGPRPAWIRGRRHFRLGR